MPSECKEFQKLNGDFIAGTLPFETALCFTRHLRHCPECMKELEAYFMFYSAIRYLDDRDGDNKVVNIENMLKSVESEANYLKTRNRNLLIALVSFVLGVSVLVALVINGQIG